MSSDRQSTNESEKTLSLEPSILSRTSPSKIRKLFVFESTISNFEKHQYITNSTNSVSTYWLLLDSNNNYERDIETDSSYEFQGLCPERPKDIRKTQQQRLQQELPLATTTMESNSNIIHQSKGARNLLNEKWKKSQNNDNSKGMDFDIKQNSSKGKKQGMQQDTLLTQQAPSFTGYCCDANSVQSTPRNGMSNNNYERDDDNIEVSNGSEFQSPTFSKAKIYQESTQLQQQQQLYRIRESSSSSTGQRGKKSAN
ncbi:9088_t:CDS:2 [Ambispora leptoticha]|uniref:9088_t:CDS:1 n=1 Tax=Ambispora leptoticha TaxID=144679 RepID=A0A9N9DG19_9GLOM|nr:9088_t:CDS:2 [Ambispora leptoticha]